MNLYQWDVNPDISTKGWWKKEVKLGLTDAGKGTGSEVWIKRGRDKLEPVSKPPEETSSNVEVNFGS